MAILEAKRPILEAKMPGGILHEAKRDTSAERARPIAKLESSEYSLELRKISYAGHPWQDAAHDGKRAFSVAWSCRQGRQGLGKRGPGGGGTKKA